MAAHVLLEAEKRGIRLYLAGANLAYKAPPGALTADLRTSIVEHKSAIIQLLVARGESHQIVHPSTKAKTGGPTPETTHDGAWGALDFDSDSKRSPRTPRERILAQLFSESLRRECSNIEENFFDLGGDSILAAGLIDGIRSTFNIEIPLSVLIKAPTVAAIACYMEQNSPSEMFDVLLPLRPTGNSPALFCVHPIGGCSWSYAGLLKYLAPDVPLFGLQARGIIGNSLPAASMEEMAADYLAQIRKAQPNGPYHLLGWSAGAIVAHAIATMIQDEGGDVAMLASLDGVPIGQPKLPLPSLESERIVKCLRLVGYDKPVSDPSNMSLDKVSDLLHLARHPLAALSLANLAGMVRTVLQMSQIIHTYVPEKAFKGQLIFFQAERDHYKKPLRSEIWKPYVSGEVFHCQVDAQHGDMMQLGALDQIGPIVAQRMRKFSTSYQSTNHD